MIAIDSNPTLWGQIMNAWRNYRERPWIRANGYSYQQIKRCANIYGVKRRKIR